MKYFELTRLLFTLLGMAVVVTAQSQTSFTTPTTLFVMHSSGNHLKMASDESGQLEAATVANAQRMTIVPDGNGYYYIKSMGQRYLAKVNAWNTSFVTDSATDDALFSFEQAQGAYIRIRCKGNGQCIGTDSNDAGTKVFSDKNGSDIKHFWFFSDKVNGTVPTDTLSYAVFPSIVRQKFDGWGVSLCWWAGQCGKWNDRKIDEIVTWMTSPTGLNYKYFRYNIGGGDDPENKNCTPHHMGNGKGLRAEMEGFKDFSGDEYHWDRDEAQRNIMLKIREKRPDAVFEAFSNSCPYYMTYSGCVSGNTDGGKDNLKPEFYEEFAHYLVDVCKHYKDEYGIEFKTLEPFNESVTGFWFANGPQEGCHFDYASQVNFIKVLKPILDASGLSTVISASDETNVGLAVNGYKAYKQGGVLTKIGQWNTHTYSGSNADRVHMAFLAHQDNIPLWMSEVGAGGNGIGGNLSLTQKLFDDMRYLQPETWIDWQYMEEANDQWCTIRGSFKEQSYSKVKNFYVRQQCSRFIKSGYNIVASLNDQSLAAMNEAQDTLVLVLLNEGSLAYHCVDLSQFAGLPNASAIKAYRTSSTESLKSVKDFKLNGFSLMVKLPTQSITTLVLPVGGITAGEQLEEDVEYIIVPRHNLTMALTAAANGAVTIENTTYGEDQRWKLKTADGSTANNGGPFILENARGQRLTSFRASGSQKLTAQTSTSSEQQFYVEAIDLPYYKISPNRHRSYSLDLSNANSNAGTTVCTWQYTADTDTPTHRQWMLCPLRSRGDETGIYQLTERLQDLRNATCTTGVYDLAGRCVLSGAATESAWRQLPRGIYVVCRNGERRMIQK
ncbi:MAG: RICIN domain-containing protein [Bacteroidaceae bacterium]|nr:RICIN domain-containing protein [Bacteroidaceae bacterium]